MIAENSPQMLVKVWSAYIDERGGRLLDLEVFDPTKKGFEPLVTVYGLNPAAVAMGVMSQRSNRPIPIVEYVDVLTASLEPLASEEISIYH
jgi:hypothetical protein